MHGWDAVYRKVVYHGDAHSLFSREWQPTLSQVAPVNAVHRQRYPHAHYDEVAPELSDLVREAALKQVKQQLFQKYLNKVDHQGDGTNPVHIFSVQATSSSLHMLVDLLTPQAVETSVIKFLPHLADDAVNKLLHDVKFVDNLFFKVVSARPSRAHLAGAAAMENTDLGIMVLRCKGRLWVEGEEHIRIETTGVSVDNVLQEALQLAQQPLVLSLASLDVRQLRSLVVWPQIADVQRQSPGGGVGSDPVRVGPPGNGPWAVVRCCAMLWTHMQVNCAFLSGIVLGSLSWLLCVAITICGHDCSTGPAKSRTHPLGVSVICLS